MTKLPTKKSKIRQSISAKNHRRTIVRTHMLVEAMIATMEAELFAEETSEQWARLFGSKDSAVVNLQKLVQLIGLLSEQAELLRVSSKGSAMAEQATLSKEDMDLLADWLKTSRD